MTQTNNKNTLKVMGHSSRLNPQQSTCFDIMTPFEEATMRYETMDTKVGSSREVSTA